jgi:hypothetical protein
MSSSTYAPEALRRLELKNSSRLQAAQAAMAKTLALGLNSAKNSRKDQSPERTPGSNQ